MPTRSDFMMSGTAAAIVACLPGVARAAFEGTHASQAALLALTPRPKTGAWVRLILGSGTPYQKQIGVGAEPTEGADLNYFETQVGLPGGSCNPNTMTRIYTKEWRAGSLLAQQPVLANVSDSGTTMNRWADVGGGQTQPASESNARLLDLGYLYDDRPLRVVSHARTTISLPAATAYAGPEASGRGPIATVSASHIVAEFVGPTDGRRLLTHVELWTTPAVPFGLARYRAYPKDFAPFDMHVYSYGIGFKSALAMPLKAIRAMTPDGVYTDAG